MNVVAAAVEVARLVDVVVATVQVARLAVDVVVAAVQVARLAVDVVAAAVQVAVARAFVTRRLWSFPSGRSHWCC